MCYEFERLYWLQRAEQIRREQEKAKKSSKTDEDKVPPKPSAPDTAVEQGEPVPV